MADTTVYTLYPEIETDERGRYFDGQFLTAQDFVDEQRYHTDRLRRALDLLTVAGVAHGLELAAAGPWLLRLQPGTAVDGRGRLLVVPALRDNIPVPHDLSGGAADVTLFYAEVESRVQGGTSEEQGTRGATRLREVPALEFHPVDVPAQHPGGVRIGRVRIDEHGAVTLDPAGERACVGLRLPAEPDGGPELRSGGLARPNLLQGTGDLAISGKLVVGALDPEGALDVRGLARVDALSVREHELRVDGDEAQFYPVVFRDLDWTAGAAVLELTRADAQVDAASAGALIARLRWHAGDGHGAELFACEIVQTRRFIAGVRVPASDRLLAVWLRGGRTYAWRAGQRIALVDASAVASKQFGGETLDARADVDPTFDRDRVAIGAVYDQIDLRGSVAVAGDLAYSGKLRRLDVAEQAGATVRAHDFLLGHSTRRGQPGRALVDGVVDSVKTLSVNVAADWPTLALGGDTVVVQGALVATGATTLEGALTGKADVALKKALTVDGAVTGKSDVRLHKKLTVDGALAVGGPATVTGSLAVTGGAAITGELVAHGKLRTLADVSVAGNLIVNNGAPSILVQRARTETTGGCMVMLDLQQADTNPATVPEVGVALRFQHTSRYSQRIEARGDGFHLRDGNPATDGYRALHTGDLFVHGQHVVAGPAERLRTIRGTITASGTIADGKGFTVSRKGNTTMITFTEPFTDDPTVVATQQFPDHNLVNSTGDTRDNAVIVGVKTFAAYIKTGNGGGDGAWRRFHFIAIGPY